MQRLTAVKNHPDPKWGLNMEKLIFQGRSNAPLKRKQGKGSSRLCPVTREKLYNPVRAQSIR